MIIDEVKKINNMTDNYEAGLLINYFWDEFRKGRDQNEILLLLNCDDDEVRLFGYDILNEISLDFNTTVSKEIVEKLKAMVISEKNELNKIRAYDALYGIFLDRKDINGLFEFCLQYRNSENQTITKFSKRFIKKFKSAPVDCSFDEFLKHLYAK